MKPLALLTITAIFFVSCGQPLNSQPPAQPIALGIVNVEFSGNGSTLSVNARQPRLNVGTLAFTNNAAGIQMSLFGKSSFDFQGFRYLSASYRIRNADAAGTPYTTARNNLSFVAVSAGAGIDGTAISRWQRFDGSPVTNIAASSVEPSAGQALTATGPAVQSSFDDLQVYSEADIVPSELPRLEGVSNVFPYGFVVRNPVGGNRVLSANPSSSQFDGLVTFAVKVPLTSNPAQMPYTFAMTFQVSDDPVTRTPVPSGLCNYRTAGPAGQPVSTVDLNVVGASGTTDACFGSAGRIGFTRLVDTVRATAIQRDGKFVLVGSRDLAPLVTYFSVARYNKDGSVDTAFATNGVAVTPINDGIDIGLWQRATAVVIQPDNRIVVAGVVTNMGSIYKLVRYNTDGSLDQSFGTRGIATATGSIDSNPPSDLLLQPDGKILVIGAVGGAVGNGVDFGVARLNTDGSPDLSFGVNGLSVQPVGPSDAYDDPSSAVLQNDGKIVVAGYSTIVLGSITTLRNYVSMARFNADGSLDTSFQYSGQRRGTQYVAAGNQSYGNAVAIHPTLGILVAGTVTMPLSGYDFLLCQFLLTSASCNNTRFLTAANANIDSYALKMAVQSDGKILVAGDNGGAFVLFRYTNGLQPDASFGADGLITVPLTPTVNQLYDLGMHELFIQESGKIVVMSDTGAVRYNP